MGLFSGIAALTYSRQREITLENKILDLMAMKNRITERATNLVSIGSDLDPESPEFKTLEDRRAKLVLMEKKLDQEIVRLQTSLKQAQAMTQTAQQIVDNSIKRFSVRLS